MSTNIPDKGNPSGTVEVHGLLNFNQFYYQNADSDADTIKIELQADSVRFRPNDDTPWKENLKVFDDAYVGDTKVVRKRNHTITARLQGIDAPELHYEAQRRGLKLSQQQKSRHWMNYRFRQNWGAKAVYELEKFLKSYVKSGVIQDASIFSKVDSPNDVFDIYGRFVGDIVISKDDSGTDSANINHWLVEQGWAFPAFYNSMTKQEIEILDSVGKEAKNNSKGIWAGLSDTLIPFDPDLRTPRGKNTPRIDHATDRGGLNMPKIFRRQVDYEVKKKAKVTNARSLTAYIETKKKDTCYISNEFLENGTKAKVRHLSEFIDADGNIKFEPNELIFKEDASAVLKDSRGKKITRWDRFV
jgi:endonuclease YncB( thermonuclease family)